MARPPMPQRSPPAAAAPGAPVQQQQQPRQSIPIAKPGGVMPPPRMPQRPPLRPMQRPGAFVTSVRLCGVARCAGLSHGRQAHAVLQAARMSVVS
jgi:hypothetical protein